MVSTRFWRWLYLVAWGFAASAAPALASETITYSYDALGRLVATSSSGGANSGLTTSIAYDPAGNRQNYTVGGVPSVPAGIVADGSFENPPQNGGYTYDPTITGIAFSGNSGIASNGSDWGFTNAPDGSQEAFLQGGPSPAVIAMAVSGLTPGATYTVRFSAAQRSGYPTIPVAVSFTDGGSGTTSLGTYTPSSTAFSPIQTATFTAGATTGTVTFTGSNASAYYCTGIDAVSIVPAAAAADASFETPAQNGGYAYNPTAAGISFTGNSGIASNGSAWGFAAAPDGSQEAFLQGGPSPATITMAVSGLTPGATYAVRFWSAQRPGYFAMPVAVAFNGSTLGTSTAGSTAFAQTTSASFTATAATGTLTFTASNSSAYYCAGIDGVAVVPVP